MKIATCALALLVAGLVLAPAGAQAGLPDGKIAVVRVTAVDGLTGFTGPSVDTRSTVYSFDGSNYSIDRSALGNLDGVETLVLVDRRRDSVSGGKLTRAYGQEVRAVKGTYFEVADMPGKVLAYQVATVGGNLRLLGDGDQILCRGGEYGPYHIWKVEGIDLIDRSAVVAR